MCRTMRKIILSVLVILCLLSTIGFTKSTNYITSDVETVKSQQIDDQKVILEGTIGSYSGDEKFVFNDDTGEILMEVDDDFYGNPQELLGAKIRAYCEVEAKFYGVSVEADQVDFL